MPTEKAVLARRRQANDTVSIKRRFMRYVERATPDFKCCWEWRGSKKEGYGRFFMYGGMYLAHRASYILFRGLITGDLFVLHQCDNKGCVNPYHMRLGTHEDNMREARERGRMRAHNRILTDEDVIAIRAAYRGIDGEQQVLGEKYGVSHSTITSIVNGHSYQHLYKLQPPRELQQANMFDVQPTSLSTKRPKGERHHKSKLTIEQVREMRAASKQGVKGVELARRYGISTAQVSSILRGEFWREA